MDNEIQNLKSACERMYHEIVKDNIPYGARAMTLKGFFNLGFQNKITKIKEETPSLTDMEEQKLYCELNELIDQWIKEFEEKTVE